MARTRPHRKPHEPCKSLIQFVSRLPIPGTGILSNGFHMVATQRKIRLIGVQYCHGMATLDTVWTHQGRTLGRTHEPH